MVEVTTAGGGRVYCSGMTLQPTLVRCGPVSVVPMQEGDREAVRHLLRDLPVDYPGGQRWLNRRLDGILAGEASSWLAHRRDVGDGRLLGVVISTPKATAMKLSTIFIAPDARRTGVGALLLDRAIESARAQRFSETYVTVAHHKSHMLWPLLRSRGFTQKAVELNRYGPGRHELVFTLLDS